MAIKNTARYMANSPMLISGARQMMSKMGDITDKFPGLSTRVVSNMLNATKDIDDEEERKATLNELYRAALPIAQNNDRLDERDEILNQKAYELSQMQDGDQKNMQITALKLGDLSNKIKRTYSDQISADADDNEVLNQFIAQIPNGQKMLEDYLNNGDKELLYAGGLATKQVEEVETPEAQGGGAKSLVNNPDTQNMFWDKQTTAGNVLDMMNLIGEGAEDIDNVVNRYLPTITGEKAVNNLVNRINNLSDEEIAQLRQQYSNMINSMEEDDRYTAGEIAGDFLRTLWHGTVGDKEKAQQAATRLTQAVKKEGERGYEISREAALDDESFKKWLIDNQATFGEYMIGANETLQGINSPNVVKFFSNIPGSAVKTLTATIRGMTNPYDTLSGLVKLIGTEEGHQALLARYGSWDAIANTMNTDPVGFADDVLSITQMAGGLTQKVGKLTGLKGVENFGGYVNTNIGSATDAIAGNTVGKVYGAIDNNMINSSNKLVSKAGKYLEATSNLGKAKEAAGEIRQGIKKAGERGLEKGAEFLTKTKSAQDKLFQAQEPTINKLSKKNRSLDYLQEQSKLANELVVKDIQQNGGALPTDTSSRLAAHETAMKNKRGEIEKALGNNATQTIDAGKIADVLDDYITKEEGYHISANKSDLEALKQQSQDLRDLGKVDIMTMEAIKERLNGEANWGENKLGHIYDNGIKQISSEIGKIEDSIISEIPGEFQKLKNEFGALKETYSDVLKADIKQQRAKQGNLVKNYSRISGIADIVKGVFGKGNISDAGKGLAKVIGGEVVGKITDKDFLIEQGFKELANDMGGSIAKNTNRLDFSKKGEGFAKFRKDGSNYMIMSVENPMGKMQSDALNQKATANFRKFLDDNGIEWKAQKGMYGNPENSQIIAIDNPQQRNIIDKRAEANNVPQAENIIVKDGYAYRYDPRTFEAYKVNLKNSKLDLPAETTDFYSELDGRKYQLPLYNPDFESKITPEEFLSVYNS